MIRFRPSIITFLLSGIFLSCIFTINGHGICRADSEGIQSRPNVLFFVVDDLRPNLGCYGYQTAHTPHLDQLAQSSLLFERAYCQIPSCSPSRSSFLTGLRPDVIKVYANKKHFRETVPDAITLPQYFKQHGYHTQSLGKVFHGICKNEIVEDPPSWSVPAWRPEATQYLTEPSIEILRQRYPRYFDGKRPVEELMALRKFKGPAFEAPQAEDTDVTDGRIAAKAVQVLGELKKEDKPFFLAVGFVKPHAPFVAPQRYFDLVDPAAVELPAVRELPQGTTPLAATSREMQGYFGVPQSGVFPPETTRRLTSAYDACVAFVDAQIGLVLDELDRLGLRENTIIVVISDHGYHLGEVGQWCKNTNFEEALRVPLLISVPDAGESHGRRTRALVELLDLYPTLVDLCELPPRTGLAGTSFKPLLAAPDQPWKKMARSQHTSKLHDPTVPVGYSVRTDQFRYTQWRSPNGKIVAEELYRIENCRTPDKNLASDPAEAATLAEMRKLSNIGTSK